MSQRADVVVSSDNHSLRRLSGLQTYIRVEPFLRPANREPVRLGHNGFPQPSRGILAL